MFAIPQGRTLGIAATVLMILALTAEPAAAQEKTLIINRTKESIYYATAIWEEGRTTKGPGANVAVEPTNYWHVEGWWEIKPGETATLTWLPLVRIEKGGKAVLLPKRSGTERFFPLTAEPFKLSLVEKDAYTRKDVPNKKGYILGRGFFEYRGGGVAEVFPDSKTVEDFSVDVGPGGQQVKGKPPSGARAPLPKPTSGMAVWVEWKPNEWYRGKIVRPVGQGYEIAYDDGEQGMTTAEKMAFDQVLPASLLSQGVRVIAKWSDGKYYPGVISHRKSEGVYEVKFDDGEKGVARISDIRRLAR